MAMTLGTMLRAERKKRDLTIYDIAGGTRIMQSSIQALEDDDYSSLPAPGYVRGYILSYCRYLRLDAEPFLRQYEIDTGNTRQSTINDLVFNKTAVTEANDQHDIPWRTALIIGAVLLVIVVAVFLLISLRSHNSSNNPTLTPPPASQESTATSGSTTATPSKSGSGSGSSSKSGSGSGSGSSGSADSTTKVPAQTNGAPFSFTVQAKTGAASQLTVMCDGIQAYSGSFTSGMKQTFQAQTTATLTIANPSALTVTRDGQAVKMPSAAPATVTLSATTP